MTCEDSVASASSRPGTRIPPPQKTCCLASQDTSAIHLALATEETNYPCIILDLWQVKFAKYWQN